METTRILDHYRTTLANDRLGILILAQLARQGPQTEGKLLEQVDVAPHEARRKLDALFRANFVRCVSGARWADTSLAKTILVRLGIIDAMSHFFIDKQLLDPVDKSFLKSFIELKRDDDAGDEIKGSLLKLVHYFAGEYRNDLGTDELTRYVYAALVGLSTNIVNLDATTLCSEVAAHMKMKHKHLQVMGTDKSTLVNAWIDPDYEFNFHCRGKCQQAIDDAKDSDLFFGSQTQSKEATFLTRLLSWTRMTSTLAIGKSDLMLTELYRSNPDRVLLLFDNICERDLSFADHTYQFLANEGQIDDSERTENRIGFLKFRFKDTMKFFLEALRLSNSLAISSGTTSVVTSMGFYAIVSEIKRAHTALEKGEFDSMENHQAEELRIAAANFSSAIDHWIKQRATTCTDEPGD